MSLFSIFSGNYYKSKTRNIMTELCYDRWFTTLKNDKVLIEQTKKQVTYSFAGQKLTTLFQQTLLTKSLSFNFCSTRPPPAIVRPLQVKFEQLIHSIPKFKVFMWKPLVYSIMVAMLPTVFVFDDGNAIRFGYTATSFSCTATSSSCNATYSGYYATLGLFFQQYYFAILDHMLRCTWLILIACNDFMTYQGHIACFYLNF